MRLGHRHLTWVMFARAALKSFQGLQSHFCWLNSPSLAWVLEVFGKGQKPFSVFRELMAQHMRVCVWGRGGGEPSPSRPRPPPHPRAG